MATVYEYNNQTLFEDKEDAYTPEEIQAHYSRHFKELNNATYTVVPPKEEGAARKIVFAKRVGTKG